MTIHTIQPFARDICKVFGVKNAVSFDLHLAVGEVAKVTIKFAPDHEQTAQVLEIVKKYHLTEVPDENP